ncbi:tetratricopeptide repeat protein, partial [Acinetobacter baumannii]
SDNPSAIAFYTSLIEINPKLSDFYLSRAKLYEKSKKFAEAEGDLNMCIKLQPNDTLGYESRGSLRASMHRNAEALTDYTA